MEREAEIRGIAYQLWETEGKPEGKSLEHYYRAARMWEEGQQPVAVAQGSTPAESREAAGRRRRSRRS